MNNQYGVIAKFMTFMQFGLPLLSSGWYTIQMVREYQQEMNFNHISFILMGLNTIIKHNSSSWTVIERYPKSLVLEIDAVILLILKPDRLVPQPTNLLTIDFLQ